MRSTDLICSRHLKARIDRTATPLLDAIPALFAVVTDVHHRLRIAGYSQHMSRVLLHPMLSCLDAGSIANFPVLDRVSHFHNHTGTFMAR